MLSAAEILRTENREGGFLKEELEERKKADLRQNCKALSDGQGTDGVGWIAVVKAPALREGTNLKGD